MLGFNRNEALGVWFIFLILGTVTLVNMRGALRKARDAQRKADIRSIHDALLEFQNERGSFPLAFQGKIVACDEKTDEKGVTIYEPCEWHFDGMLSYLTRIPSDPYHGKGVRYHYISNGNRYQIYAALEGENEDEYDEKILKRNLDCGNRKCNFGRSYAETPLDISIEEYENEVNAKKK